MRCSSPTVSQRKTTAMSRRKQSNPKPLKPGEDSEWTTNEESVGSSSDAAGKCDEKVEQHQPRSPSPRPSTAESPPAEELPAAAADSPPKLRINANLATDPARWSPVDAPSPQRQSPQPQPPPPPLPPPPPPATVITATAAAAAAAAAASSSASSTSSSSSSSSSSLSIVEPSNNNVVTISAHRPIQIFVCNPCGIRFSSLSTLDAHQTYYCSRRHKKDSESDDAKMPMVIETDEITLGNDTDSRPSSVEPSVKSARTGKQYKCPHCSYSADKKVSLNRHMRMHSVSPVSAHSPPGASDAAADPSVVDRYCQDCDIRFSNLGTYQAHKMHYCKTRHVVKPTPTGSPMAVAGGANGGNGGPSPPTGLIPACTYLALPTNPVIVVPYALVQNASVLPAMAADPSPPADTACIVLADGTLQPIAQALVPAKFAAVAVDSNDDGGAVVAARPRPHHNHLRGNQHLRNHGAQHQLHQHHRRDLGDDDSLSPPVAYQSPPPKKDENVAGESVCKRPTQARPSSPLDLRLKRAASRCPPLDDGVDDEDAAAAAHAVDYDDDDGGGAGEEDVEEEEEEKENRRSDGNVTDAEDIVCAPSIPCMIMSPSSPPLSSGNRTPHRPPSQHQLQQQQQQQQQQHQMVNGGVIQKPRTPDDGAERNGKFSVSSLLHNIKQESGGGVYHNNNNNNSNNNSNNNNALPPAVMQYKSAGGRHNNAVSAAAAAAAAAAVAQQRNDPHHLHHHLINPAAAAAVLPYFTSDMTLRLAAAAAAANPADPAAHHQFFLKQGPSKCESCNIVFCKYENFLAHKKHYCASRPGPGGPVQLRRATTAAAAAVVTVQDADAPDAADKTSPEGSPGGSGGGCKPPTVASPQSSKDSVSPGPAAPKPPMIQFICSTCGVKFSSFDNLTTHQSYYCPNRMAGGPDTADKPSLQQHARCPRCKMIVDASSAHHHQCPTAANCWKCPVCGAVCTSASAAQKHLDNHNGIRAFVCTICQYKGNTLRGLRTHIRMHFNKRVIPDLMEEDYVSCVIDENSASSTSADRDGLPKTVPFALQPQPALQDVAVQLQLQLQQQQQQQQQQLQQQQQQLAAAAAVAADRQSQVKAGGAVVVVSDDDDSQKDAATVVVVKQERSVVDDAAGPPASSSADGAEPDETAAAGGQPVVYHRLHESPAAAAASSSSSSGGGGGGDDRSPGGGAVRRGSATAKYCKACDISFNYLSTFIAHKKYYCRNSTEYKACSADGANAAATVQT